MKEITILQLAGVLKICKRSARARMATLMKQGKAIRIGAKGAPNRPGIYKLTIPIWDIMFGVQKKQKAAAERNAFKKFCVDPFNLYEREDAPVTEDINAWMFGANVSDGPRRRK